MSIIVASIALSAGTPSFPCPAEGSCQGNAFFAVVAWIAPLLFAIHSLEFAVRVRRLAAVNPAVWSTATWLVQWEGEAPNPKDLERGVEISGPKALILPQAQTKQAAAEVLPPKYNEVYETDRNSRVPKQFQAKGTKGGNRLSKAPLPPPKSPGAEQAQFLVVNPAKTQYVVPRLGPAPKYFIQIPDNIQYTVPRIGKPPCPKTRAKERRRARKTKQAQQKRYQRQEIQDEQEGSRKWGLHF